MGRATSNIRLDFADDPDHEVDPRNSKGILSLRHRRYAGNCANFADNSRSCRRILLRSGMSP